MKKIYLLLPLLILFIISPVFADSSLQSLSCCSPDFTWNTGAPSTQISIVGLCFTSSVTGQLTRLDFYMTNPSGVTGTMQGQLYSTTGTPGGGHCASLATLLATSTNTINMNTLATTTPVTSSNIVEFTFSGASISSGITYIVAWKISSTQGSTIVIHSGSNVGTNSAIAEVDNYGTNPTGALNQAANDGEQTTCPSANFCIAFATFYNPTTSQPASQQGSSLLPFAFILMLAGITFGIMKSPTDGETKLKLTVGAVIGLGIIFLAFVAAGI